MASLERAIKEQGYSRVRLVGVFLLRAIWKACRAGRGVQAVVGFLLKIGMQSRSLMSNRWSSSKATRPLCTSLRSHLLTGSGIPGLPVGVGQVPTQVAKVPL